MLAATFGELGDASRGTRLYSSDSVESVLRGPLLATFLAEITDYH